MRLYAFVLLATLCACKHAVPPSGFGVDLTIDATHLTQRANVVDLTVSATGAETFYTGAIDAKKQIQHGGIVRVRYVPKVASGTMVFDVDALDVNGNPIGVAQSNAIELVPGKAVELSVVLTDPTTELPDMALADIQPATCNNMTLDPGETDVDCGGPCSPCEPGKHCSVDTDCATQTCLAIGTGDMLSRECELATGPPGWVQVQPLPTGRAFAGAAGPPDGTILIIGGKTTANDSSTFSLSLDTNTWTQLGSMSVGRSAMPVALSGNRVLAFGGQYTPANATTDASLASIEAFDLTAKTWSVLQRTLSGPRNYFGAAVAGDNHIYVVGGAAFPDMTPLATFESLDPNAPDAPAALDAQAALPVARQGIAAAADTNGRIVAIGGLVAGVQPNSTVAQADVFYYDPNSKAWTTAPSLGTPRGNLGASLGADGRVYAVGGQNDVGGSLADVEALTLNSDHWTRLPTISPARTGVAVTRGWDGRVYAIGGKLQGGAPDTTVQAYGPSVTPGPASGPVGTAVALAGSNFAGKANVTITFIDNNNSTQTAATGTTNASGTLTPSPVWKVPTTLPAGTYTLIAVDDRSRYPVQTLFTVTP